MMFGHGEPREEHRNGRLARYLDGRLLARAAAAYRRGDYAAANRAWSSLAKKGVIQAQVCLGRAYVRGEGVPRDLAQALEWFERAADQGDGAAQYNCAVCLMSGGGSRNLERARFFAERAWENGIGEARLLLAKIHRARSAAAREASSAAARRRSDRRRREVSDARNAPGGEAYYQGRAFMEAKDWENGLLCWTEAAGQGHRLALRDLIHFYVHGYHFKKSSYAYQDPDKALTWGALAEELGLDVARDLCIACLKTGDYQGAMDWAARHDAAAGGGEARGLLRREAEGAFSVAQAALGMHDYSKALRQLEKAAALGSAGACRLLGTMYQRGIGVEADERAARMWLRRAGEFP